ncbi:MAG TPA: M3 family oligoendopeptidase [Candidatus Omnitrophota bacterium]|nr:M3 family oligoendopeptidase [Candidatus Omnitrophota bacterium]
METNLFEGLKVYQKRVFVPENADLMDEQVIKEMFNTLLHKRINFFQEFEEWILNRSELESVLDQHGAILYIRMTCQTDDVVRAQAYTRFIETIAPVIKPLEDALNKKYLELLQSFPLPERYDIYSREIKVDVSLFREENISLEKELELLSQEYQKISGAMTVFFQGEEKTMPQMATYLLNPQRNLRESAWRVTASRRLQDKDALEGIFNKMVLLRHKIAQNAGFKNYAEYKFQALHRFDYNLADCKQFHQTVEKSIVPVLRKMLEKRKEIMGLEALRPWDVAVDALSRPALRPFEKTEDLIIGCQKIFHQLDEALGATFEGMRQDNLLDLQSRKGKAPGGYQSTLQEFRKPFIFMNAVGTDQDVRTLLHESGHAFHALLCADEPLLDYRHAPMEFCEVASMSMELLAGNFLGVFYKNAEDVKRSQVDHLEDCLSVLAWVATIDAFQFWIYENPDHSLEDRKKAWCEIYRRFSSQVVDWSDLSQEENYLWHRQLHIFEVPFYYIEYAIAQLGALQIWLNAKKDFKKTMRQYKEALSLGGSQKLPELFEKAGIVFDFSERTIKPLATLLEKEIGL